MNTLGSRTLTPLDDARVILDSKPPFYIRAPQVPEVRQILPDAKVLRIGRQEERTEEDPAAGPPPRERPSSYGASW
jgi:hypothetical protein